MQPPPRIAFCTTCKGRTQHLELTLPLNLADNADYPDLKIIVLNYNSRDHLVSYIRANHMAAIESGRLVVYHYSGVGPFKMAHAKNVAHRLAIMEGASILVNMDADNYAAPGFARFISEQFAAATEESFMWARWNQPGTPAADHIPKGCSGRIVVSPKAFIKVGGYDEEKYQHWGSDDKDFNQRLRRLGLNPVEIERQFLQGILHTDKMRFREYPHLNRLVKDYYKGPESPFFYTVEKTIVNAGRVGCGVVYRNWDPHPIELKPIPSRVFGIGMHKTATTSLHKALKHLGLDSAHWKSVKWAKSIWTEMNSQGWSPTLEKHYALSDLPLTMLYEKLDRAYPGSKFILTVRDEATWIESVRKHWSRANDFRDTWNKEGEFAKEIHAELYGSPYFDAPRMLERYRRHNAEVIKYFENRPDDLLVMNMDDQAGWLELCGFLRLPKPSVDYPRAFVTE